MKKKNKPNNKNQEHISIVEDLQLKDYTITKHYIHTYIHTLFEIGSVMGSQRLMWTYIKATLYK